ncbi:MAG: hypothetical protein IJ389_04320 [Clostridia bacterium]|nr:hypothetical protein [Clostridia bacterium]
MAETVNATSINENPLCARLQKKFAGRGVASAGSKAAKKVYNDAKSSKVARTADPFEETAEFVRAGGNVKTTVAYKGAVRNASKANVYANSTFEETTTFNRATFQRAYERAASIREKAANFDASTRQIPRAKNAPKKIVSFKDAFKTFVFGEEIEERKIKSTPISKGLVLSAIVIAFIVVLMLFSLAQINEFKNEISGLEGQKQELLTRIDDLNVAIDAKNDIRMIEDEATNRIGMVKSNQIATKYISLTDGERIEVVDSSSQLGEEEYGVFGNLMSVVGTNWDHLMEYIN